MVPEEYTVINRAICLLTDEYQGERELARTALHVLFRQQRRMELQLSIYERTKVLLGLLEKPGPAIQDEWATGGDGPIRNT